MSINSSNLTLEDFMKYKNIPCNSDMLPEVLSFMQHITFKTPHTRRSGRNNNWKKGESNSVFKAKKNQSQDEKLSSEIRGILNKINTKNFDELSEEMIRLEFSKKAHLVDLVNQIFMKAVTESNFGDVYAQLCSKLIEFYLEVDTKKVYFRAILILRCQEMFEQCLHVERDFKEHSIFNNKEQIFGCMAFLGELYNHDLLVNKIIFSCFVNLNNCDLKTSYSVENCCYLFNSCHKKFKADNEDSYAKVVSLLKIMNNTVKADRLIPMKPMFALADVIKNL